MTDEAIAAAGAAGSAPGRRARRLGRAAGHLVPAAPDQPAAAEGRPRSRTPSGSSRGRWPRPSGRRSWTCCTATGSLTLAPAEVWATLLDEGTYLGSVSTYYRVLREAGESRERRAQATHPAAVKPELVGRPGRTRSTPGTSPSCTARRNGPTTTCT